MIACKKCRRSPLGKCFNHRQNVKGADKHNVRYVPLNDYDYRFLGCSAVKWVGQATESV